MAKKNTRDYGKVQHFRDGGLVKAFKEMADDEEPNRARRLLHGQKQREFNHYYEGLDPSKRERWIEQENNADGVNNVKHKDRKLGT